MKSFLIALALFAFVKGPELFNQFVEKQKTKVTTRIYKIYGDDALEQIGIKFPNVVRAQVALETRWLTSTIYKKNSNLFGMKESSRDWDCGTARGHANYICLNSNHTHHSISPKLRSLYDYRDWQIMRFEQAHKKGIKIPETEDEYIYFLQHLPGGGAYAEDPLYPSKLRYIMNLR